MGMQLNENTYQKLINQNIKALNKHMPDSLEKKHIIEVLKWSIGQIYHCALVKKPETSKN